MHKIFIFMVILGFILTMVGGAGLAQASPENGATPTQARLKWFTDYIEQTGDVGAYASIAFDSVNGTPWISYYDADITALRVAYYLGSGGNCNTTNDWICDIVDMADNVGTYSSIDVYPHGDPLYPEYHKIGVAHYDSTNGSLKFTEYYCADPCGWTTVTVQAGSTAFPYSLYGQYASMKYDEDGKAHIAYYNNNQSWDDELQYAYEVTGGGNCGEGSATGHWECQTVDSGPNVGKYASLDYDFIYDKVVIAYYDGNSGDLKYAGEYEPGFGNCGTDNQWVCSTVDGLDGSDVGKFASIHFPDNSEDTLKFAYYDATQGKLKYATDVGGGNCGTSNLFHCEFIESIGMGLSKAGISLAVDADNYPIIAYMRHFPILLGTPTLRVAQPVEALGLDFGNCGPEIPNPSWQCTTIDSGDDFHDEAEYASIAIDLNGQAMIAYSELELLSSPTADEHNLKIAYQREALFLPIIRK